MKIDTLIAHLERVRKERGNIDVIISAFGGDVGAHYHHATFSIQPLNKNFNVANRLNDYNELCLPIKMSDRSIEHLKKSGYNVEKVFDRIVVS